MHPNQQTIEKFYSAFARLDAETMGQCYAPGAVFEDSLLVAWPACGDGDVANAVRSHPRKGP